MTSSPDGDIIIPEHIAIIMDGNGRWAKHRTMPRVAGHRAGVESVRKMVKSCRESGVKVLTLFAFSSENWRRPPQEVSLLMDLFMTVLKSEAKKLSKNNVQLRVIGDVSAFSPKLQDRIKAAIDLTKDSDGLILNVAANYGGRWDIVNATKLIAKKVKNGDLDIDQIDDAMMAEYMSFADLPEPDLFIRTGGDERISNFLLWHLAYTEFYFTDILWPDFGEDELQKAIEEFSKRERRFGQTGEQVRQELC
ncbi:MAG: isoprenyl transferase [Gammaproteobacteria bacterium]|nr:isoprenyl transferase [Gammaproteobacteria bacterium]